MQTGHLKSLVFLGLEGLEEGGQGFIQDKATEYAMRLMKERYGDDWEPKEPYEPEDLGRSMVTGAVTAGVVRGAGRVASMPAKALYAKDQAQNEVDVELSKTEQGIVEGKPAEEVLKVKRPMLSLQPIGEIEARERGKAGLTDRQKSGLISRMPRSSLISVAKSMDLMVKDKKGKSIPLPNDQLREMINSNLGLIKEGPRLQKNTDGSMLSNP